MTTGRTGRRRWLGIALLVSLGLNLAVLGIAGGAWLRGSTGHGPGPDRPAMVRDIGFGPWARALTRADHAALRQSFEVERPRMREVWRAARADREALLALLRAEPLDLAAANEVFDPIDTRNRDRLDMGQRMIREHILAMSAPERAAFADRMEEATRHGPRRENRERERSGATD